MQGIRHILTIGLLAIALTVVAMGAQRPWGCRHPSSRQCMAARRVGEALAAKAASFVGERHQLVLLASFTDLSYQADEPLVLWSRVFNEKHFQETPFYGSVHDYFYDQSYGRFDLQFDLYEVPVDGSRIPYRSVGIDDSGSGHLLSDLLDCIKDDIDDWSPYDWDGDGYVDQVLILFPGQGQNTSHDVNAIWAHQWSLSGQGEEYGCDWGKPYPVTNGDGREYLVDNYGIFPELGASNDYGSFGTICHEYGHCLGLPDFYYGSTHVVDSWDIMDYGNYNMGGFSPPGYSAHERMVLGWLEVQELTEPTAITQLGTLPESQQAYLVRNDGYANEYYIVENRQQTGWDRSLPGSGLLVFHIDYDEEEWQTGTPNSGSNKRYTLFHANSLLQRWAYPFNNNDQLTNVSNPKAVVYHQNTDGTLLMNKPLTDMAVDADGRASFVFMNSSTALDMVHDTAGLQVLCRWGDILMVRDAAGRVRKVVKRKE